MKLVRANDIFSKLRYFVPKDICTSVYYSLFYTHIICGCLVWFYCRKSNTDRSIKLQKRCIRVIKFFDFNTLTDPKHFELKLLKANDIFSLIKLFFIFYFIKKNIPEDLKRLFFFNKSVHSHETRSSQMFHIPKGKTSRFGLNTLSYDNAKLWNRFFHAFCNKETDLTKSKLKYFVKNTFP